MDCIFCNTATNTPIVGTEEIVEYWKGVYNSAESQRDYVDVIRNTFTHSNDESD